MDTLKEINEIIDCPKIYLLQYYDNLKAKLDIQFVSKLRSIQDAQLKQETQKQWIKLIEIIDICLAKCIKNTIPTQVVNETKEILNEIKSKEKLEIIKAKLQSYLFSNDFYISILISQRQELFIIEEGLKPKEIESFLTNSSRVMNENFGLELIINEFDEDYTLNLNNTNQNNIDIFHLESFKNVIFLKLNLKSHFEFGRRDELDLDYMRRFPHLNFLTISRANIQNSNFLSEFKSIKSVLFNKCNLKPLDNASLLELTHLTKFYFIKCKLIEINLNYLIHLNILSLEDCNITELTKDMFVNLFNLKKLNVGNSESGLNLHRGCFNGLNRLEKLHLIAGRFSKLEENIFSELENLEILKLMQIRKNNRVCLEKRCFNGLKRLRDLEIENFNLVELDHNHLIDLESLENLKVYRNPGFCFQNGLLKRLKRLNMSYCEIIDPSEHILEESMELEKLILHNNNGICITKTFFSRFCGLRHLKLTECLIREVKRDTFSALNRLLELQIGFNQNIQLQDGCFNGLNRLKYLNLSNCNHLYLRVDVFLGLSSLETLKLNHNPNIIFENDCFVGLNRLKCLDLTGCNLIELIGRFFFRFDCLETLNLANNPNMFLHVDCFNGLNRLKCLDLSQCSILKLEKNQFLGLNNLETLNLNFNSNIVLEVGCLNGLNRLVLLDLSKCNDLELKEDLFFGLNSLSEIRLKLNRNVLFKENCLNGLNQLKLLDLSECENLQLKENMFFGLDSLETLDLRFNSNLLLNDKCFNGLKNNIKILT